MEFVQVRAILSTDSAIGVDAADANGNTLLSEAAVGGQAQARAALRSPGPLTEACNRCARSREGSSGKGRECGEDMPALTLLPFAMPLQLVQFLLEHGANPNSRGAFQRTPLWRAAFGCART